MKNKYKIRIWDKLNKNYIYNCLMKNGVPYHDNPKKVEPMFASEKDYVTELCLGIYDGTKFDELPDWYQENLVELDMKDSWNGNLIYEGDIIQQLDENHIEVEEEIKTIEEFHIYAIQNHIYDFNLKAIVAVKYEKSNSGKQLVCVTYQKMIDVATMDRFPSFWLQNEEFGYEGEELISHKFTKVIGNVNENPEILAKWQNIDKG